MRLVCPHVRRACNAHGTGPGWYARAPEIYYSRDPGVSGQLSQSKTCNLHTIKNTDHLGFDTHVVGVSTVGVFTVYKSLALIYIHRE